MGLFNGKQLVDGSVDFSKISDDLFDNIPIASSDKVLTNNTAGLKTNISLVVEGSDAVLYGKDNIELGRINVTIGAIQDAYYDNDTTEIVIVVNTSTGSDELRIPAIDLVDIYTGKEYINVDSGNVISLDYSLLKDQFINDGFAGDADAYYKKSDSDSRYLKVTGGTVSGDLAVNGQLSAKGLLLTESDDIDILLMPGYYRFNADVNVGGTFPINYSSSATTAIHIIATGTSGVYQVLYNDDHIWYRRAHPDINYPWYELTRTEELKDYLPLSGGTVKGDLGVNGRFTQSGITLTSSDNIDTITAEGKYTWIPASTPSGTLPARYSSAATSMMFVYYINPDQQVQIIDNDNNLFHRRILYGEPYGDWVRMVRDSDLGTILSSYLPLEGGTVTGDLTVDGKSIVTGNLDAGAFNYPATLLGVNDNIDELVTIGRYYAHSSNNPQGTYPDTYRASDSLFINVYQVGGAVTQVLDNNNYISYRRINTKTGIIGRWYTLTQANDLESYLPLTGGILSGDLTVEGGNTALLSAVNASLVGVNSAEVNASTVFIGTKDDHKLPVNIGHASRIVNINSSKATYNGSEIATVDAIPDTNSFVANGINNDNITISSPSNITIGGANQTINMHGGKIFTPDTSSITTGDDTFQIAIRESDTEHWKYITIKNLKTLLGI